MRAIRTANSLEDRALGEQWSLWSWSLYILLPLLMLAVVFTAIYASGSTKYWNRLLALGRA